jgi:tetratricopeptide (TPR) repeat protein
MLISMHKELERIIDLLNREKFEEASQLITNFQGLEDLNVEDKHYYRFIKGAIFLNMGRFQESLKIVEEDYQESKILNKPLFLIDSIFIKWNALFITGRQSESWEDVVLCEEILKSASQEASIEVELREGFLNYMKGYWFYWEKNYDKAIEHHKKSLGNFKKYDIASIMVPANLQVLGLSYTEKGELDLALEFHHKSLDFPTGNSMITNMVNATSYHNIGEIFFQKGEPDNAIEYYKKSLLLWEQYTPVLAITWVGINYDHLINAFLFKKSPLGAQNYLDRFHQYLKKNKISEKFYWYRLSKARTLRSSSRIRERAEAERTLKEIIEGHEVVKSRESHGIAEEFTVALIELCDFYLEELGLTNDLSIIDDIQPLITRLLKESNRTNSFTLQTHSYLLQGKISLLQMNMGDARRYLTQAQYIAEEHSLQLLARAISTEHDKLLEQLDKWVDLNSSNASISERLTLASLNESVELMQRKRAVIAPELTHEEPVLLLILGGGGILLFSYPFSDEVKVDDELFGGFLSAIASFSDEVFSEGLDRAKFGSYTVLMNNVGDFSFCYVLKGQTYLAQKKLSNFTENFQKNTSMMQTLDKFNQSSQAIEIKDFPFLEGFIKETFTNN